jgi:O-succinylbenzoic acid--CoA ligase
MASQITTSGRNAGYKELITAGYPLSYRKIKINDNGEILVRGETLAKGYLQNNRIHPVSDEQGWFHTGDRGQLDENGRLLVVGRLDNMFVSGGENIYPEEIERVLCEFEGAAEAVVVPVPDKEFGERPAAFIRWENMDTANYTALKAFAHASLSGYMRPDKWFNWPEMKDKIKADRKLLREIAKNKITDDS